MDKRIKSYLQNLSLGDIQTHRNMGVVPLLCQINHDPEYITLKEALDSGTFIVSEISREGSVPELKVVNKGRRPVLLLDGEELAGAKQNRVLNTTILVDKTSDAVIPVSCTEQGRWSYTSRDFTESGTVMSPAIRMMKSRSVSNTLADSRQFRSDQGTVWTAIQELSSEAEATSRTGAMRDVFEARKDDLDAYVSEFTPVPEQKGIAVFIDGRIIGFDFISRSESYKLLHPKLIKSYSMEALLSRGAAGFQEPSAETVLTFLKQAAGCREKKYKSVGLGWDFRYEGKTVVGSALKVESKIIHAAFFTARESDKAGRMADSTVRRRFRTR